MSALKDRVTRDAGRIVLTTPRRWFVMRGLNLALGLPSLAFLAVFLLIGALAPDIGIDVVGPLGLLVIGVATVGGVSAGGWKIVRSAAMSAATRVVIDPATGSCVTTTGTTPLTTLTEVVLRQPNAMLKWLAIEATVRGAPPGADNAFAASRTATVRLLDHIEPRHGSDAATLGRKLAKKLDLPMRVEGGVDQNNLLGLSPHTASMACYLPIQGIFLIASVGALAVWGRNDPLVRFHAKQSLALFAAEIVLLIAAVVVLAVGVGVGEAVGGGRIPITLLAVTPLVVVALGRLGLRLFACHRAYRGRAWIVPGLGWLSRRWLPDVQPE